MEEKEWDFMDAVVQTLQYWPLGTAITAGGVVVVVALGVISPRLLNDQKKKSPNHLPPVPGDLTSFPFSVCFSSCFCWLII